MRKNVLIIGCTHSVNSGVMAMAESIIQKHKDSSIKIFSSPKYIKIDIERYSIYPNVEPIIPSIYKGGKANKILLFIIGLLGFCKKDLKQIFQGTNVVYDISGDSISHDYGTMGVLRQIVPILIGNKYNENVILMPQSIGPFKNSIEKIFVKKALKNAKKVFLRETSSEVFLKNMGFTDYEVTSDLAFSLESKVLDSEVIIPPKTIALGVSDLIKNYNANSSQLLTEVCELILKHNYNVLLVNHVTYHASNDLEVASKVKNEFIRNDKVIFLNENLRASEWKTLIGQCDAIISARMHPVVHALSLSIPALNLSYNHKSQGVVKDRFFPFGNIIEVTSSSLIDSCEDFLKEVQNGIDFKAFRKITEKEISQSLKAFQAC